MPIGIIVNVSAVVLGGLLGAALGKRIPERVETTLTMTIGLVALAVGISLIVGVVYMGAVALALILGVVIGELLKLDTGIKKVGASLSKMITKGRAVNEESVRAFSILFVIFCFSGLGIFGSLNEGMTGDYNILLIKSILDFATVVIFAAAAGYILVFLSIPMLTVYLTLFFVAKMLFPLLSETMIADFQACAGSISIAAGLTVLRVKEFRLVNFIPALILVLPISYLWYIIT